jgi:chromate transporter
MAGMGTALPVGAVLTIASAPGAAATPVTLGALTWLFVKVGSLLFGSGYVLLAFLRADLVERWHWLTTEQLLDAIAVGQITPGPVFTTATFIGYILAGTPGAVLATVGIFAPAFVFVWLTAPQLPRLRSSPVFSALLDGVVLGSLGLMASVSIFLAIATLDNLVRVVVWMAALLLMARRRPNTLWLIAGGAAIGWLTRGL